jgi:hypothetical protein
VKRWLKRIGIAGLALLVLIVALVLVEHVRGRWMLSRRISVLEARGEVLSVTALEPQRPPADQNAVLVLMSLTNRLKVMRSAAERPAFDSGFDYRKGFVDFQLGPVVVNVKRAVQGLSIATLRDLRAGHLDAANTNLCALVRLAVNQKPEPLVKDDNGDPSPSKPEKKHRQLSDGRDAVWPVAATEAEAEAAVKAKNE